MLNGDATPQQLPSEFVMPGPAVDINAPSVGPAVPAYSPNTSLAQDGTGVRGEVLDVPGDVKRGAYRGAADGLGLPGRDASVATNEEVNQPPRETGPSWGTVAGLLGAVAALIYIFRGS
jgi:hypothetical protein